MYMYKQYDKEGNLLDVNLFMIPHEWSEEDAKDHVRYLISVADNDTLWLFEQMKISGFHRIISNV